ncbi:NAD-dependent epimerase/dehydratase family protein [Cloacibacillus sp. An23]|uniref:NAD-dependent epimerase/dehydratase family protein n=1 Tax=Cloacibacillus sp. An23 TaxID=1965591 RepID=UPI000B3A9114|nr:NAD-dependent epimerase/dehydratase family protein [Cloacibacillus sp. An23]OUO92923.1 dTDP-glucose 4,6-dehydratase [Cloacibacillus sp. An23]
MSNELFEDDIRYVAELDLPWNELTDKAVLITGASGLIGSFLVNVLMYKNRFDKLDCNIYAIGRNKERADKTFCEYQEDERFQFIAHDINVPMGAIDIKDADYVLHLASNTHPIAYAEDPIGTITANVIGTNNMLEFAVNHNARRLVFASSNEIYGENRGDAEFFDERYCGYIDCNTLRAGYPESKRCGEALCQAYIKQKGLDAVVARFTRTYGPTMLSSDTKAIAQFIKKAAAQENIVLKSDGKQFYSYTYVADAVSGLLTVMLRGKCGEAYNIADKRGDIRLKDLAEMIAGIAGTNVVFELPDDKEKAGYSTATKARLNGDKLKALGWNMRYDVSSGMWKTLRFLMMK